MQDVTVRLATASDVSAINAIYNHYVTRSTCTYQTEVSTADERQKWFDARGPTHPVTVAMIGTEVVGWGALSPFHPRGAYRRTVENAVYIRHDMHRRGVGKRILLDLIARAKSLGHHVIIALIDAEQTSSVALHTACGFTQAGRLHEVGNKFDRWLDVIYMERKL